MCVVSDVVLDVRSRHTIRHIIRTLSISACILSNTNQDAKWKYGEGDKDDNSKSSKSRKKTSSGTTNSVRWGEAIQTEHNRLEMSNTSGGSQSEYKVICDSGANFSLFSDRARIVGSLTSTSDPQEKASATGGDNMTLFEAPRLPPPLHIFWWSPILLCLLKHCIWDP